MLVTESWKHLLTGEVKDISVNLSLLGCNGKLTAYHLLVDVSLWIIKITYFAIDSQAMAQLRQSQLWWLRIWNQVYSQPRLRGSISTGSKMPHSCWRSALTSFYCVSFDIFHHVIINNLTGRSKTSFSIEPLLIIGAARVNPNSSISKKTIGCISVNSRISITVKGDGVGQWVIKLSSDDEKDRLARVLLFLK